MSNCLIIAGEKSGEEHCLSFFNELKTHCPETRFWGVGGDSLKNENMELIYHLKDFSTWGISGVFGKIGFYLKALKRIKKMAIEKNCKTAILIDFQTFNLILAWILNRVGVKVLYYVAPQAWAWKAWRTNILKKVVHTLFAIIPFEKEWFQKRGVKRVRSVTHPLRITYKNDLNTFDFKSPDVVFDNIQKEINLLLLPGSRNFEVEGLLSDFFETVEKLKIKHKVIVHLVKSPSVNQRLFDNYNHIVDFSYSDNELIKAFQAADLCLAASGTVTLATALFEVPTVICYRSSLLNVYIFETLINYDGPIGLGNIIHQEYVSPELIQDEVSSFNIIKYLELWITDKNKFTSTKNKLKKTRDLILGEGIDVPKYMSEVIQGDLN